MFSIITWENISEVQGRASFYTTRKLLLKLQWHLLLIKVAPMNLCPCIGSWVLNKEMTAMHCESHYIRSSEAVGPFHYVALWGQAPLCWNRTVADWLGCDLWTKNWSAANTRNLLPSPTDTAPVREEKSFWATYPSISYRKSSSIIILWDYLCMCGPLLTKMSLHGTWLPFV